MVLSDPILAELDETLTVKFGVSKAEVDSILKRLRTGAERTHIEGKSGWVALDPGDDKCIETALVGGAGVIVSGDRHLLTLGTVEGIEIRQFLDSLAATG